MSEKAKEILSDILGYIVIAITCALYVLTAIFTLNPTGKSIWQIVGDGLLVFCMGVTLDHLFSIQGVVNGMKTKIVNSTMVLYGQTVEKINGIINKLGDWCSDKNRKTYEAQRTKILSRAGLRYKDCFEEDGTAKPYVSDYEGKIANADKRKAKRLKKEEKFRNDCYWNAVKLKLSELYPNTLTSEGGKKDDPSNLGKTINEYMAVDSVKTWVAKIFFAFVLGIYGITLIADFSWLELLWRAFQICLFTVFGIIKMKKSTMFITNDYRGRIIKKIDFLEEFYVDTINNKIETKGEVENAV